MKIGRKRLKMSSGEVKVFKSEQARDNFEKIARAYRHGWGGPDKQGRKRVKGRIK